MPGRLATGLFVASLSFSFAPTTWSMPFEDLSGEVASVTSSLDTSVETVADGPSSIVNNNSVVQDTDEPVEISLKERTSIDAVNQMIDANAAKSLKAETYYFGFDLRGSPQEDARQYLPFLDYLSRETGYIFKLRFSSKHSTIADDLGTGKTKFAAVGAVSFIQARIKYGVTSLARGINPAGKSEYQSFIVARPDSHFQRVADLKGARFAFGSETSTQGHLIPRIILADNGIELDELAQYSYMGSHQKCANAVINGEFDACGMQDTMARSLIKQGFLRLLYRSNYYPSSGIAANKDVPPEVVAAVTRALVQFDPAGNDKDSLYEWQKTEMPNGFEISKERDYTKLADWLERLGLVTERRSAKSGEQNP